MQLFPEHCQNRLSGGRAANIIHPGKVIDARSLNVKIFGGDTGNRTYCAVRLVNLVAETNELEVGISIQQHTNAGLGVGEVYDHCVWSKLFNIAENRKHQRYDAQGMRKTARAAIFTIGLLYPSPVNNVPVLFPTRLPLNGGGGDDVIGAFQHFLPLGGGSNTERASLPLIHLVGKSCHKPQHAGVNIHKAQLTASQYLLVQQQVVNGAVPKANASCANQHNFGHYFSSCPRMQRSNSSHTCAIFFSISSRSGSSPASCSACSNTRCAALRFMGSG